MEKSILSSSRGYKLALLKDMPPSGMSHILIACHGFLGGKENGGWIDYLAAGLKPLGIGLVAFDFEGCGESEGDFAGITLSRQVSNLREIMAYVRKDYEVPQILLGRSFGGSTVLAADKEKQAAGLILWSAPVFMADTFYNIMPAEYEKLEKGLAITYRDGNRLINLNPDFVKDFVNHDMDKYLLNLENKPLLVIHGTADKVVSPANCHYIAEKLPHAQVHMIEAADHSFTGKEQLRIDLTLEWLQNMIG